MPSLGVSLTMIGSSEPTEAEVQAQQKAREDGERTAEKIRYGQTISEGGMSGFTAGQGGEAKQGKALTASVGG